MKGDVPIREYHRMHISISPLLFDRLKECSIRSGYTMNTIVCTAINEFTHEMDKELKERGK